MRYIGSSTQQIPKHQQLSSTCKTSSPSTPLEDDGLYDVSDKAVSRHLGFPPAQLSSPAFLAPAGESRQAVALPPPPPPPPLSRSAPGLYCTSGCLPKFRQPRLVDSRTSEEGCVGELNQWKDELSDMTILDTALSGMLWSCLPSRKAEGQYALQVLGIAVVLEFAALKMRIQPARQKGP